MPPLVFESKPSVFFGSMQCTGIDQQQVGEGQHHVHNTAKRNSAYFGLFSGFLLKGF